MMTVMIWMGDAVNSEGISPQRPSPLSRACTGQAQRARAHQKWSITSGREKEVPRTKGRKAPGNLLGQLPS